MTRVVVTGWNPGFKKIETNKLLRAYLGYDLREAKDAVDAILKKERLEFSLAHGEAEQLYKELDRLGASCQLQENESS